MRTTSASGADHSGQRCASPRSPLLKSFRWAGIAVFTSIGSELAHLWPKRS